MSKHDLAGQTFNRLTVLSETRTKGGSSSWICRCQCGNVTRSKAYDLTTGKHKSCGCLARELTSLRNKERLTRHGMSRTPTYACWTQMRARCLAKSHPDYPSYGARGIQVCNVWSSFERFLADMGKKPAGLSLDRIDVDGNYGPENCRWATPKQQVDNRRITRFLTVGGTTKPLTTWAAEAGLNADTLRHRVRIGWTQEMLFSPSKKAKATP